MIDFQQKKQFKRIMYSRISLVILFIVIIFLVRSTYDIYKRSKLSTDNYSGTKKEYDSLKERYDMLESEIQRLKTDVGIEEEIRSKFNVARPGETVVTVINGSSSSINQEDSKKGFWSKIWGIFQ